VVPICEICWQAENSLELKRWSRHEINELPDEAFAVIEPAYAKGETRNKNARHLPHHLKSVRRGRDSHDNIDEAHIRNALSLVSQITPVTNSIEPSRLRQLAREHLNKHSLDLSLSAKETKGTSQSMSLTAEMAADSRIQLPKGIELVEGSSALKMTLVGSLLKTDISGFDKARLQADGEKPFIDSIEPQESDFILVDFRAISKSILPDYWLNFTKGDVLKNSLGMYKNKPVFLNHRKEVGKEVGVVIEERWDETGNPEGINTRFKIDAVANPRTARSLLSKPPLIGSDSISFHFDWEKSHPDLDGYEFWENLGRKVDGELVTIDVTEMLRILEVSLVYAGGDPDAVIKGVVKAN